MTKGIRARVASAVVVAAMLVGCGGSDERLGATQGALASLPPAEPMRTFVVDGPVHAMVQTTDTIYLGGAFSYVGQRSGPFVGLLAAGAGVDKRFPELAGGDVKTIAADGLGGWYVGGSFKNAGGTPLHGLVHLNGDGTLDNAFRATGVNDARALVRVDQTLFVGGPFNSVQGTAHRGLVALDALTGRARNWNLDVSNAGGAQGRVLALAMFSGSLYVAGDFETFAGAPRAHLAVINPDDGALKPLLVDAGARVSTLAVRRDAAGTEALYVGGEFSSLAGGARSFLAALNKEGQLLAWDPNATPTIPPNIRDLALGSRGGELDTIYVAANNGLHAIDSATGARLWSVKVEDSVVDSASSVTAVAVRGNVVYAAGQFDRASDGPRRRLAAFDSASGALLGWYSNIGGLVYTLAGGPDHLFVGGDFSSVGGHVRRGLAAIDRATRRATPFGPRTNGVVYALALSPSGDTLYVGGTFDKIGTSYRRLIAAVATSTGNVLPWNPILYDGQAPDPYVRAIDARGSQVFAGGKFVQRLVSIDAASGKIADWFTSGLSQALVSDETSLYAAMEDSVTAIDKTRGTTRFRLSLDAPSYAVAVAGDKLYIGGAFTNVGGTPRTGLAVVDVQTGSIGEMNLAVSGGYVRAIAVANDSLFLGGSFAAIDGVARTRLALVDRASASLESWAPKLYSTVYALALTPSTVSVGGSFQNVYDPANLIIDQQGLVQYRR